MQGDVTRIVSMSNRDRRGLIDELAGVALFDTRIEQSRRKLDDVQERQDRCRIVEQELLTARQRLEKDCAKARAYQDLRDQVQRGRQQELVLAFEAAEAELKQLKTRQHQLSEQEIRDSAAIKEKETTLSEQATRLQTLQESVKALGEDQLLSVQAELAGLDPQNRALERQATQHQQEGERLQGLRQTLTSRRQQLQADSEGLKQANNPEVLQAAEQACRDAEAAVEISRRRLGDVAGRSGAWLDEQRQRAARRSDLQTTLTPLQEEQQQLQERLRLDEARQSELQLERDEAGAEDREVQDQLEALEQEWQALLESLRSGKEQLQERAEAVAIQQRTRTRLEEEQTRLEREIARLESRREALQETRGTGALRLLLEAGLDGIHGAVAQLGEVEDRHRLALEVAAGARMAQVVVDDDRIAARAIDLLKSRRAGRLTFLPLNKIRSQAAGGSGGAAMARGRRPDGDQGAGLIARAVELIRYEPIYSDVFGYVFGDTQVFSDLGSARQQIGRFRAVTLEGELLEKSGAMTGGSFSQRSGGLSFGVSSDSDEAEPLRQRLLELGETLVACRREESRLLQALEQERPRLRQLEQRQAALDAERTAAKRAHGPLLERCRQRSERLNSLQANRTQQEQRLLVLKTTISPLLDELERISTEERKVQAEADAGNCNNSKPNLNNRTTPWSWPAAIAMIASSISVNANWHKPESLTNNRRSKRKKAVSNAPSQHSLKPINAGVMNRRSCRNVARLWKASNKSSKPNLGRSVALGMRQKRPWPSCVRTSSKPAGNSNGCRRSVKRFKSNCAAVESA